MLTEKKKFWYEIDFDKNFIEELCNYFILPEKRPERLCIVFPGKRPALYVYKYLHHKIGKSFVPPVVFSIEEFIDYILTNRKNFYSHLSLFDGVYEIFKIVNKISSKFLYQYNNLRRFFSWGRLLLDFFNQIDLELLNVKQIQTIEKVSDYEELPPGIKEILTEVSLVYKEFVNKMEESRRYTRGYTYRKAVEIIKGYEFPQFDKIIFAGLFATTKAEKEIIKYIVEINKGIVVVHGNSNKWNILKELRDFLNVLAEKAEEQELALEKVVIHPVNSKTEEIVCSTEIVQNWKTSAENILPEKVVVMPSSELLFPALNFLCDRINMKYNISLGYPLKKTPLVELFISIIESQLNARRFDNLIEYKKTDYINVIMHPFIKNLIIKENQENTRKTIHFLFNLLTSKESNLFQKSYITLDECEAEVEGREILQTIHNCCFRQFENINTIYELAVAFQDLMDYVLDKGPYKYHILSGEISKILWEIFEEIKETVFSKEQLIEDNEENRKYIFEFIRYYLTNHGIINFNTSPLEDLQLVGLLETRALNFKKVIILDVNEGIIPPEKKIDPLIPLDVKKALNLPLWEHEDEISKYYFERLVYFADEVHLIYVNKPEIPRSRFIEQIIWKIESKYKKLIDEIPEKKFIKPFIIKPFISSEPALEIEKSDKIMDTLKNMEFTPASIDAYLECPLKFYFQSILKLSPALEISEEIDGRIRGTLIHQILQSLFDTFAGINEFVNFEKIYSRLEGILNEKIPVITGEHYVFKKLVSYKLKAFLDEEKDKKIKILAIEKKYPENDKEIKFYVNKDIDVKLGGKIDRIDKIYDENEKPQYTRIIDYKTGEITLPQARKDYSEIGEIEDIEERCRLIKKKVGSFQLPVYLYIYKTSHNIKDYTNLDGIFITFSGAKNMSNRNKKLVNSIFREGEDHNKVMNYFLLCLKDLFKEMFNQDIPFRNREKIAQDCNRCVYKNICRQR